MSKTSSESSALRRFFAPRQTFSRIVLHGIFLVIATALTVAGTLYLLELPRLNRHFHSFHEAIARDVCAEMEAGHAPIETRRPIAAAMYSLDGRWVSSQGPALNPLTDAERALLLTQKSVRSADEDTVAAICWSNAHYLILRRSQPYVPALQILLLIAVGLAVIVVGSLPLVRSIVAPLADLVTATRRFGRGEMSVRTKSTSGDEVGDLARAFDDMADRVQQLLASQKELLANISHELRTPLARVRVVVEMAQDSPSKDLLTEISTDLTELEKLVEDILDIARLDVGDLSNSSRQRSFSPVPLSLFEVAQSEVQKHRLLYPQRVFKVAGDPENSIVAGDANLLARVVRNLLQNAQKYSHDNQPIEVSTESTGNRVSLVVRDFGTGIDPADLPFVFVPFYRTDKSRNSSTGGAGLGLALAKRIVELHGGEIALESRIDEGTTARVTLPICTSRSKSDQADKI